MKRKDNAEGIGSQRNEAGSTIVAGMLQVRPKGATQVAPALFYTSLTSSYLFFILLFIRYLTFNASLPSILSLFLCFIALYLFTL